MRLWISSVAACVQFLIQITLYVPCSIGPQTHKAYIQAKTALPNGSGVDDHEAIRIVQQERDNLEIVHDVIMSEGWQHQVDYWRGELCEVYEGKLGAERAKAYHEDWLEARHKYGHEGDGETRWLDEDEAKEASRW